MNILLERKFAGVSFGAILLFWSTLPTAQTVPSSDGQFPFATSRLEYPEWSRKSKRGLYVEYCESLLQDLKSGSEIQFLRLLFESESIEQLDEAKLFGKCNSSAFIKSVVFEPKVWEATKNLPKEEQEKYGTKWLMSKHFMVFSADFDRKPSNGRELVLYGGGFTSSRNQKGDFTHFVVLDLESCKPRYSAQVYDVVHCIIRR